MNDIVKAIVWCKSSPARGLDNSWKLDPYGRLISWAAYGDRSNPHGWEIGHIVARADGGADSLHNLQAEHWHTNVGKEEVRRRMQLPRQASLREAYLAMNQPATNGGLQAFLRQPSVPVNPYSQPRVKLSDFFRL